LKVVYCNIGGEHAVYSYSITNTVYSKGTPTGAGGVGGGRRREVRFILAKAVNEEDDEVHVLFKAEAVNTNDDDLRRTGLHLRFLKCTCRYCKVLF
jgi:hypothetical protein